MTETFEQARARLGELPPSLACLHEAGRLAHYWPAIEEALDRTPPPPAAAVESLLLAVAAHECKGPTCCTKMTPDITALPEFIVFFSRASNDMREPEYPVAATCCVCASVRAKGTMDWYPRALAEPLLPEGVLYSHGMCLDCASVYDFELAI